LKSITFDCSVLPGGLAGFGQQKIRVVHATTEVLRDEQLTTFKLNEQGGFGQVRTAHDQGPLQVAIAQ
jgi:hypothetical protein